MYVQTPLVCFALVVVASFRMGAEVVLEVVSGLGVVLGLGVSLGLGLADCADGALMAPPPVVCSPAEECFTDSFKLSVRPAFFKLYHNKKICRE